MAVVQGHNGYRLVKAEKQQPYGHSRYDVYSGETYIGYVVGGGERHYYSSRWWTATTPSTKLNPWGETFRYNGTRGDAVDRLVQRYQALLKMGVKL